MVVSPVTKAIILTKIARSARNAYMAPPTTPRAPPSPPASAMRATTRPSTPPNVQYVPPTAFASAEKKTPNLTGARWVAKLVLEVAPKRFQSAYASRVGMASLKTEPALIVA